MICFAILAHANEEVLADQIENIKRYNPHSKIVLYNGGTDPEFGKNQSVPICPYSKPLQKGKLGSFMLDVMRWLEETGEPYNYLINLDSDVMFIRQGYEKAIQRLMVDADCMGINMFVQQSPDDLPHWYPGQMMWREWDRWQPFFGTDFFCGCLNVMQVYRRELVSRILNGLDIPRLETLIEQTNVYALEEMLVPTLAVRSGGKHRTYPHTFSTWVRLDRNLEVEDLADAQQNTDVYFVHPIERSVDNAARHWIGSQSEDIPTSRKASSLTISWGCFQGGVETTLLNRLKTLNQLGYISHAYFYYGGTGLNGYNDIPYAISNQRADLKEYLKQTSFQFVTFINTLYNLDVLNEVNYQGKVLFEFHGESPDIFRELMRINERQTEFDIHAIIVPSQNVANIAHAYLTHRPDLPIYIAYNTLNTGHFTNQDSDEFRYHYNIPDTWRSTPLIGWVGRLDPNKNWRLLLRVYRKLLLKYQPNAKLLIASDLTNSPQLNDFFRKVMKYHLMDHLMVLPNVPYEKMPAYYSLIAQSGGALLSTSYCEGYPYNLLEAQACYCPVVCSDISGTREIVEHYRTGLSFPLDDSASLPAHYLQQMISDHSLRTTMVQNARAFVCQKNDILRNAQDYIHFLIDLAANSNS